MKNTHKVTNYSQCLLLFSTFFVLTTSCRSTLKNNVGLKSKDTIFHGYNELANPSNLKSISISDYNTDNPEVENITRPKTSKVITNLDTAALFHSWTKDPDGPCTDFVISKEIFYVADYDGDGAMPYELIERKLKIYYNDFIQEGEIISVTNDTLKIHWKDMVKLTSYVRWTQ